MLSVEWLRTSKGLWRQERCEFLPLFSSVKESPPMSTRHRATDFHCSAAAGVWPCETFVTTVAHNQQLWLPLFPLKELSGSVTTGSTTKRLQRNSFETLSVWAGRQVSLGEGKRWSKRKAERSSSAIGCSVAMLHWLLQKHLNARESMNEKPGCTQNLIISTYTQTLTLQCYTTEEMQLRHKSPSNNIWQQHGGQAGYLAVTH